MRNEKIHATLRAIADALFLEQNKLNTPDLIYGQTGVAVFFTLYALLTGKEEYFDYVGNYISDTVERLNNGYEADDITKELTDFGLLLEFLSGNSLVEINTNDILEAVDTLAKRHHEYHLEKGNFDHVTGALTSGYYYLARIKSNPSVVTHLGEILSDIDRLKIVDDDGSFYLVSPFNKNKVYLGIPHGLGDVIIFLHRLHKLNIQPEKCAGLIKGMAAYILKNKYTDYETLQTCFPNMIGDTKTKTRLSLFYGDLGTGYALLKAAETLQDESLKKEALDILTFCANRTADENTEVKFAAVIYGSAGNAMLFNKIYKDTGIEVFKIATDFWIDKTLEYAFKFDNEYAGYKGYYEYKKNETNKRVNVAFGEGIAGIGSVLCNYVLDEPLPIERFVGIY